MCDLDQLVVRYVAMWNEPDSSSRRAIVEKLWTSDAVNLTKSIEARGYDALERRVTASYEKWGRDGGHTFRLRDADTHHDVVRVTWEMVPVAGGPATSIGIEFLMLAEDGRIRADYQFIEASPR